MKVTILILVVTLFGTICSQDNPVKQTGNILTDLAAGSQDNLDDLNKAWSVKGKSLYDTAKFWADQRKTKLGECNEIDGRVQETVKMIEDIEKFYNWTYTKIDENNAQVKKLGDQKCTEVKLWLDNLAHNNLALELIDFLQAAIEKAEESEFVSQSNFLQITQLIGLYRAGSTSEMIQLKNQLMSELKAVDDKNVDVNQDVQARSENEVGKKHIDNDREKINVDQFDANKPQDFKQYKAQILELLATLKKEITQANESGQKQQVEGNLAYAEFKNRLGQENQAMAKKAEEIVKNIPELKKILFTRRREWDSCKGELDLVENSWMTANFQYNQAYEEYKTQESALLDEIQLFEYVVKLYNDNVNNSQQQQRVSDAADGKFDQDYKRGVNKVDWLDI